MGEKVPQTASIQVEMIRALLANGRAVMDLARQLDLTPREVRNILQESLMQFGEPALRADDRIPIAAHAPREMAHLTSGELGSLIGGGKSGG